WPAKARSRRIGTLNHEVRNHAVEDRAIVKFVCAFLSAHRMLPFALALRKVGKILHRLRRLFLKQAADNGSFGGIKHGISTSRTGHDFLSMNRYLADLFD